jgi:hypothetical protein
MSRRDEERLNMNSSPKLIRMVGTGDTTEINDTRFGLLVPDADNAIFVPQECVAECEIAGFRIRELTQGERLARVYDAIDALDPGDMRTAFYTAATAESLHVIQARQSAHSPA